MTLYNKIRIIFLVAFVLLSAFFASTIFLKRGHYLHENEKRYMQTALFSLKHFRQKNSSKEELKSKDENFQFFLKESNFELLEKEAIKSIKQNAHLLLDRKFFRAEIEVLKYEQALYLFIKHPKFELLLKDKEEMTFPKELLLVYLLALAFLVGLYFWLSKSLKPLKALNEKIHDVAQGDLSVSFKSDKEDEIAEVSNAFDDALRKIEALIDSRQLFLRTIMHELKTPIAKGRLLNEFLEESVQKEGYERVFERLELLIAEFSKIEQMLSSSYKLNMKRYNVQEMLDQALELMIMSDEEIESQVEVLQVRAFVLETDFELFSLALKNLIDNALKYSPEHKVRIEVYANRIEIHNAGEQFTQSLEAYAQPFNVKAKGLGLGLYIVQNIAGLLGLELVYTYDKKNIFVLCLR
ncbi:MAG: Histidine kinase [uncultured Sulfurovum sp.]|uniref:histidine kinase n=1 Tax=uncultured Sulfurovum sp. TaxID=269237 RepID=A0A6S6U4P4_9BACT|nr:MAG: Histidine kinase [uncultured Sulfurovum sp.]